MIRAVGPADRASAHQLLTAQLIEHRLPADPDGVASGIDCALAPQSAAWLWLAERDATPVAVLLANQIASVEHGGLVLWIEELYVIPTARRRGVARALLARVCEQARERGVRAIELEVVPTQAAAFALYRALGFDEVRRRRMSLAL
ncbi:MAG TPA: GNAT family N-acetyltransferase [Myxococcaceae bacterium]|nr:GNAT family N-acetyltransferase [Myxococcaceae bacterium]